MDASQLVQHIQHAAHQSPSALKEDERVCLLAACENLKRTLESPTEATMRFIFGAHQATALRVAIEMSLFDATAQYGGGPVQIQQLAATIGADVLLTLRIMRLLCGMGIFKQVGHEVFAPTPLAGIYVAGSPLTEAVVHITSHMIVLSKLPDYLERIGFQNPSDAFDGPFQYAMGTESHYFEWLNSHPRDQNAFDTVMDISRMARGEAWFEFYPVEERLRVTGDEPLLVDVGGGLGHDLIALKAKFPNIPGKLVVQDLPTVIDHVKDLPPGIEAMKHDFFSPQPLKDAKAYYLGTVLQDWPDKQVREILKNIKTAMNKDSILLINENVLAEANIPLFPAMLDLSMMAIFSSLGRTRSHFMELLTSAGFKLLKVWRPKVILPESGTLFEAALQE